LGLVVGHDPSSADVAVAEPADAVQQLDVAQIAFREDLLDRERRREKVECSEAPAGPGDLPGNVVAVAQRVGQVGGNLPPMTSRDDAFGSSREDTLLKKNGSSSFPASMA
jgi:hypothetical protein